MSLEQHLIGPPLTAEYEPPYQSFVNFAYDPNRPIFTSMAVDSMLTDPRVTLGMALLRGPILSNSRFFVHCDDPEAKEFIATQINRYWRNGAGLSLRSMRYGWQPAEIIYRNINGQLQYDRLRIIHPRDAKARTLKGCLVGMDVTGINGHSSDKTLFIGCPKTLWSVHNRHEHRWYGRSRLYGSFPPWYEKWARRGFRDQRQLWFYKYAFRGPIVSYPPGAQSPIVGSPPGTPSTDHRLIAQMIGDAWAAGNTVCIPAADPTKPSWGIEDPVAANAPDGFLEYGYSLDDEIWEGMEIPPEIARSAKGGADGIQIGGGGGRDIPQQAFFSILSELSFDTINDFDEQCISQLVAMRYGRDLYYEIECFGLLRGQDQDTQPGAFEQSQGDETTNLGNENDKPNNDSIQMADNLASFIENEKGREPISVKYNKNEEKELCQHYRRHSDYQFRITRSA